MPLTVAVIGPTNVDRIGAAAGISGSSILAAAATVGALLASAGHRLVVVPDRGVAVAALDAYRDAGGPEVIGIAPSDGPSEILDGESVADGSIAGNLHRCDVVIRECTWFEQHHTIGRISDAMVCIGLSPGTLAELAWTKWTPGPPTVIIAGTSSPPPPELLAETPVIVISLEGLGRWLGAAGGGQ
jgi:predicted Rossmann-fold nucleotide-binding protein